MTFKIFIFYFLLFQLINSIKINIGTVITPENDQSSDLFYSIRSEVIENIFTSNNSLEFEIYNPFNYYSINDLMDLSNYLQNGGLFDILFVILFKPIDIILLNTLGQFAIYFYKEDYIQQNNIISFSQPNLIYFTTIPSFCLEFNLIHIWFDDDTKLIVDKYIIPIVNQCYIEYELVNLDIYSNSFINLYNDNSGLIINVMRFSKRNIFYVNRFIDEEKTKTWKVYNLGNCDTRDLYFLNNKSNNNVYCISHSFQNEDLENDLQNEFPDIIVDDFSLSMYIYYITVIS